MEKCTFSIVTQKYLVCCEKILNNMISNMSNVRINDSVSADFIVTMIPHHEAAVKFSEELLKYTTDICLQEAAQKIINGQTKGVETMKEIFCGCRRHRNDPQSMCAYRRQYGTVTQNPYGLGYAAIVAAVRAIQGLPVDQKIDTGYQWLDKDTIDLETNQKYLYN